MGDRLCMMAAVALLGCTAAPVRVEAPEPAQRDRADLLHALALEHSEVAASTLSEKPRARTAQARLGPPGRSRAAVRRVDPPVASDPEMIAATELR